MNFSKQIKDFLKEHAGEGTVTIPEEVMEEYLGACKSALEELFSKYQGKFPRVSALGGDPLLLWCKRNYPEVGPKHPYYMQHTFWQGKVIEALMVAEARLAGLPVEDCQARVMLDVEGEDNKIPGHIDLVCGGIRDIKTCHDMAFTGKWKNLETLQEQDHYNYLVQAISYERAMGKKFDGWTLFNKNNGKIKDLELVDDYYAEQAFEASIENYKASLGDRPPLPEPEPEYYKGELTGNFRAPSRLVREGYAHLLWPGGKYATRGDTTYYYIELKQNVIPGVKILEKGE